MSIFYLIQEIFKKIYYKKFDLLILISKGSSFSFGSMLKSATIDRFLLKSFEWISWKYRFRPDSAAGYKISIQLV